MTETIEAVDKVEAVKPAVKTEEPSVYVNGIVVDLLDDCVRIHLGKGISKLVSYEEFVQSLSGALDKTKLSSQMIGYSLPPGTFFFSVGASTIEISCYYPECVRELMYSPRGGVPTLTRKSVIPNVIISHRLTKSKGNSWAVADTRFLSTDKKLSELNRKSYLKVEPGFFLIPFSNIYEDARMCYGANVRTGKVDLPELRPLHWYYEILFTSPFNDDLGVRALKPADGRTVSWWYTHLAEMAEKNKPFPYELLRLS
jgi:hypothetical protein